MSVPAWGSESSGISVTRESDPKCSHEERLLGQQPTTGRRLNALSLPKSWRNAMFCLKNNTVWYGQKKKLWFDILACLCPLPLSVTQKLQRIDPLQTRRLFYKQVWQSFFLHVYIPHYEYIRRIPKNIMARFSPWDSLESYPRHLLGIISLHRWGWQSELTNWDYCNSYWTW